MGSSRYLKTSLHYIAIYDIRCPVLIVSRTFSLVFETGRSYTNMYTGRWSISHNSQNHRNDHTTCHWPLFFTIKIRCPSLMLYYRPQLSALYFITNIQLDDVWTSLHRRSVLPPTQRITSRQEVETDPYLYYEAYSLSRMDGLIPNLPL